MEIQEAAALPVEASHSLFRALRHKNFRLFYTGQTISLIGTWSQALAISWLVWRLTHSAAWLGFIGFAIQIPMLILGLPGGAAADRFDRLRSLMIMQILCMLQAVALSILTLMGIVTLWEVVLLSIFLGIVYSFEFPIRMSFVMDMVGKEDLLNAVSLNAAMIHGTRTAGPVVAGIIVAWKGEGICFLFNAATFLFLIVALLMMDRKKLAPSRHSDQPFFESIKEGLAYILKEPRMRLSLIIVSVASVIGMPFISLLPIFADHVYGGGSVELGWMMGAGGFGALCGALWLATRRSTERLLMLTSRTLILFSFAIIAFSFASTFKLALLALMISNFFLPVTIAGSNTFLQHNAPDHLRGRVMSVFTITFMGLGPFGSLMGGFMAEAIGAPMAVTICGTACGIAGLAIWVRARNLEGRGTSAHFVR